MSRRSAGRDGSRRVHRGLIIALLLLTGMAFIGRGIGIVVDARTVERDGAVLDAVVTTYRHAPYAGATGLVYVANPLYDYVPVMALRRHKPGDAVKVRYVGGQHVLAAEVGAPLNTDAILIWTLLGAAVVVLSAWSTRALYREQREWERLEAGLLGSR
jgi:hypothetical protein